MLVCVQIALFHAMDLAPMRPNDVGPNVPLDTRRIVLLVPKLGLDLLREFSLPGVFMSLTAAGGPIPVRKPTNARRCCELRFILGTH